MERSQRKFLTPFWAGSTKIQVQSFSFFLSSNLLSCAVLGCLASYLTFLNLNLENSKIFDTFLQRRQWN